MIRRVRLLFGWGVVSLVATASAYAQGWALPAKTPDTMVTCVGCPNTPDGEKTVGYKAPISTFTGRFLDSQGTTDWQQTFRTARAWNVQVVGNRIYFRIGSSVAAYNVSTFFGRLASGEALMSSASVYPPQPRTSRPEEWLKWDEYFYPEDAGNQCPTGGTRPGCWVTPRLDGQDRLVSFDVDDQGYVYVAAGAFGWGIVQDSLGTGGKFMKSQFQRFAAGDPAPSVIATLKGNANRYLALVSGGSGTTVAWDVTNRTSPTKLNTFQFGINRWAKSAGADRFAMTNTENDLHIYSSDGIVTGGAPIASFVGDYRGLASDGTNFYSFAKADDGGSKIAVIRPSGSTYVMATYTVPNVNFTILRYGAGYLAGAGLDGEFRWDARIYKLDSTTNVPTEVPLIAHGPSTPIGYAKAYYTGGGGFAAPTSSYINITDANIYKAADGKYYFIICAKGLGDVYELKGADSISVTNDGPVGAVNPNVPTVSAGKTFYGDVVRFTATSASSAVTGVNWNFGNTEALGDPNVVNNAPLGSQTHQYSGIAKTAAIAARKVSATSATSSEVRGEVDVQLEVPVARFKVANTNLLFTQPNASSPAAIVVGDTFSDASDGTVSSHYASWTIDTATTKTAPYPSFVPVGDCGPHTLRFESFYGPYTTAFATTGPAFNVGLDAASGLVTYAVRPFAASIDLSTSTATTITFVSSSRFSTPAQTLPLTWTWELLNAAGTVVPGSTSSGTTTNIQPYLLQKSLISGQNNRVRLTISTPTPQTGTCAGMETSTALSAPMNAPDPVIAGGCTNGGAPCSFTVNSLTQNLDPTAQGWTYLWSVSPTTYFLGTGTTAGRTFTPTFTSATTYTVSVTATNAFGTSPAPPTSVNITNPGSRCQTLSNIAWVPTFTGANGCSPFSSCQSGEQVTFTANPYGTYDETCAVHTYTWTFSDGQSLSGRTVTRTVNSTGTASVKIHNGSLERVYGPITYTVGAVQQPPPTNPQPPTNPGCGVLTAQNIFINYTGTTSGCSSSAPGTPCRNGEGITFDVQSYLYDLNCTFHNYTWTIDGVAKGGKTVTHVFSTAGSHAITLQVSNGAQAPTRAVSISTTEGGTTPTPPVTPPVTPGGPCKPITPNVSLWIDYKNANSTCSPFGGECNSGEEVSFSIKEFGEYQVTCANHTFTWDFADGSATVTGRDVNHTYSTSGTFPAKCTVNNGSVTVTLTQSVKIKGNDIPATPPPSVDFTITAIPSIPNAYAFTPHFDPPGSVLRWAWNFGDGTAEVAGRGTPASPTTEVHTYTKSGTYTVTLRVWGPNGSEYPTHSEGLGQARRRAARH